ncbi:hypothetical protein WJX73_003594 [Symbiochloris irregularis]|uniref:Uncharacterized protein n=1 Tax=Symbiochloris irregularis TaxID=706552 RepID=A0AAW1NPM9_9CHLO
MPRGRKPPVRGSQASDAGPSQHAGAGSGTSVRARALTQQVLCHFIALAIEAVAPVPGEPLKEFQYQGVAGAAISIAVLLNAPLSFLDFLLRLPWEDIGTYLPRGLQGAEGVIPGRRSARDLVASLLDGCTPLHCAALRGNATQVDYLLSCGADPTMRTAAGELPMELVPECHSRHLFRGPYACLRGACDCGGIDDPGFEDQPDSSQAALNPECGREASLSLLGRACIVSWGGWGRFGSWVQLVLLSVLCLLHLWGSYCTLDRLKLEQHHEKRTLIHRADLRVRLKTVAYRLRRHLVKGRALLAAVLADSARPPGGSMDVASGHWDPGTRSEGPGTRSHDDAVSPASQHESSDHASSRHHSSACSCGEHVCERHRRPGRHKGSCTGSQADEALAEYEASLQLLKVLASRGVVPNLGPSTPPGCAGPPLQPTMRDAEWFVPAEEMASVFVGLSEAALSKIGACTCQGCTMQAREAIQRAQGHATYLVTALNTRRRLQALSLSQAQQGGKAATLDGLQEGETTERELTTLMSACDSWGIGAEAHIRVLAAHARLLLMTDAAASPTLATVAAVQICVRDWGRVQNAAKQGAPGTVGSITPESMAADMTQLQHWSRTAAADLALAAVLLGQPLDQDTSLGDVEDVLIGLDTFGQPILTWVPNEDTAPKLLATIETSVLGSEELPAAIKAASRFPRLQEDVAAAEAQRERWEKRAMAVTSLEAVVEAVSSPDADPTSSTSAHQAKDDSGDLDPIARLQAAVETARDAGISVSRARKLLKDLQSQAEASAAAARLRAVLAGDKPHGSALLKAELSKAQAAVAAASSSSVTWEGTQALAPAMAEATKMLEVENAAEGLAAAVATSKMPGDIPQLEAAIAAAHTAGLHESGMFGEASSLRNTLQAAARGRAGIDAALKALSKSLRSEDAEAVEAACQAVQQQADVSVLLEEDVAAARATVAAWRTATAAEARLERVLGGGCMPGVLAQAIQEASAAGVRVGEARRVLKLLQGLEAALSQAGEGQFTALRTRLDAALAGGVASPLLRQAHTTLERLQLAQVRSMLEVALKRRSEASHLDRSDALKEAIEKAQPLLSSPRTQTPDTAQSPMPGAPSSEVSMEDSSAPSKATEALSTKSAHAVTPRADSASSIFAMEAQLSEGESAVAEGLTHATADESSLQADLEAVRSLVEEAKQRLEAQARLKERLAAERSEVQAARRQQQKAEREAREKERAHKLAAEKAERERLDKERAEKRAERARIAREQAEKQDLARREQALFAQLSRERDAAAAAAHSDPVTAAESHSFADSSLLPSPRSNSSTATSVRSSLQSHSLFASNPLPPSKPSPRPAPTAASPGLPPSGASTPLGNTGGLGVEEQAGPELSLYLTGQWSCLRAAGLGSSALGQYFIPGDLGGLTWNGQKSQEPQAVPVKPPLQLPLAAEMSRPHPDVNLPHDPFSGDHEPPLRSADVAMGGAGASGWGIRGAQGHSEAQAAQASWGPILPPMYPGVQQQSRPCRYYQQGYCRDAPTVGFAFGAPGSMAFSSLRVQQVPLQHQQALGLPAMLDADAVGQDWRAHFTLGSQANGLNQAAQQQLPPVVSANGLQYPSQALLGSAAPSAYLGGGAQGNGPDELYQVATQTSDLKASAPVFVPGTLGAPPQRPQYAPPSNRTPPFSTHFDNSTPQPFGVTTAQQHTTGQWPFTNGGAPTPSTAAFESHEAPSAASAHPDLASLPSDLGLSPKGSPAQLSLGGVSFQRGHVDMYLAGTSSKYLASV